MYLPTQPRHIAAGLGNKLSKRLARPPENPQVGTNIQIICFIFALALIRAYVEMTL